MALDSMLSMGIRLSEALPMCMKKSEFEKTPHQFLSQNVLDQMDSPKMILNAMGITTPTPDDDILVEFILSRAKRLFAIATYIELEPKALRRAMESFRENHFGDEKLPIEEVSGEQYIKNMLEGTSHLLVAIEGPVPNDADKVWTYRKIFNFQQAQSKFLAPVITTNVPNHDFWDLTLPFTKKHAEYAEGSFGKIFKYEIHENHIRDHSSQNVLPPRIFAVKEIKVDNEKDRQKVARHWASEVKAMAMMNTLDHKDHIVRFITAFRRGKPEQPEHYIITEWADGGNLRNLWNEIPNPPLTASFVKAVVDQLLGISEAFCAAHYLTTGGVYTGASYRHGDLKPANILWFRGGELGTLKICDWGEAKNKQFATAMRHSKTSAEYGTRRYEPPEVETGVSSMLGGQEEKRRSRLYDLWAIGCITLEIIVWLLYGADGLEKFNNSVKTDLKDDAPFYQFTEMGGKKQATVHNVVAYWMHYIAQDPACRAGTTALGDLLELVQRGLLVVKLPRQGGTFSGHNVHFPQGQPQPTYPGQQSNGEVNSHQTPQVIPPEAHLYQDEAPADIPVISITSVDANQDNKADAVEEDKAGTTDATQGYKADADPTFAIKGPGRYRADQLRDGLLHITTAEEGDSYWSTKREQPLPKITADLYFTPQTSERRRGPQWKHVDYGQPKLDPTKWSFDPDNKFAVEVFSAFRGKTTFPMPVTRVSSDLCDKCKTFREGFWNVIFKITYDVRKLETNAKSKECDLCGLLWKTCDDNWSAMFPEVTFERSGSSFTMNSRDLPVLSISRSPDCKSKKAAELQIGFAELPEAGSTTHFEIIRQWLRDCDENHHTTTCKPAERTQSAGSMSGRLPTRLIDVGNVGDDTVRLWETGPSDTGEWIALSHQWGPAGTSDYFSTTTDNRKDFLAGIPLAKLPDTFKDAVVVTRALGNRYLWIDSICIIQKGEDADFSQEAKRMEEVYSNARCVIAASRASGPTAGFLKPRIKRNYVAFRCEQDSDHPVYISQMIDNFKEHVLEGSLNKRGWVLQEHALARRTIFFDEHQTYWECGHGVRCETMTTLHNESAQLLGDPNFPRILDTAQQGEKIERFQELYQVYSRLALSKEYDRPIAIGGLQQRLLRTMNVRGGFGVFDGGDTKGLLRRSLLWHRGNDTPSLNRIEFLADQVAVPSWSWMAHTGGKDRNGKKYPGGINYFKLPFDDFDWEDFQSPWDGSRHGEENNTLSAKAQKYNCNLAPKDKVSLIWDSSIDSDRHRAMCVVLGIQRDSSALEDRLHYVLLVVPTDNIHHDGSVLYERAGVGYFPGRCIAGDAVRVSIY